MQNEKPKLKAWQIFFMIVGIIATIVTLLLVIFITVILIIKPWNVNVLQTGEILMNPPTESTGYDHPLLSPQQEALLKSAGIDIEKLPTEITQDQQKCAVEALGEERANQLLKGAAPNINDVINAKHCFE